MYTILIKRTKWGASIENCSHSFTKIDDGPIKDAHHRRNKLDFGVPTT
jgi:hypothetical protein